MSSCRRALVAALWLVAGSAACAADQPEAPGDEIPKAPPAPSEPPPRDWKWEGAVGPLVSIAPDYSGSATRRVSWTPGYYLRYGRISISNASGFVTRRNKDDVFRGLGLDLKRSERVRLNAALRIDNGRRSADAPGLAGKEDVRRTIRARFSATWALADGWKVAGGLNTDLLGRGGGNVADLAVAHDRRWSPSTSWSVGVGVTAADARYMGSYFGVNEAEAARTGHPVYDPRAGLRDIGVGTSWRTEINERWVALYGASIGKVVGPAARSPLTTATKQWGVNGGLAWLF